MFNRIMRPGPHPPIDLQGPKATKAAAFDGYDPTETGLQPSLASAPVTLHRPELLVIGFVKKNCGFAESRCRKCAAGPTPAFI